MRELVRDADAAGEEEDGGVGAEGVKAAVGTLDEGTKAQDAVRGVLGAAVELGGHAGAAGHNAGESGGLFLDVRQGLGFGVTGCNDGGVEGFGEGSSGG